MKNTINETAVKLSTLSMPELRSAINAQLATNRNLLAENGKKLAEEYVSIAKTENETLSALVAEYNNRMLVNAYTRALESTHPTMSLAQTFHAPRMDKSGRTPSVRLSLSEFWKYASDNAIEGEKWSENMAWNMTWLKSFSANLREFTMGELGNKSAVTLTSLKKELDTMLRNWLPDSKIHADSADIRWLVDTCTKAGKSASSLQAFTSKSVGLYLTDIIHGKLAKVGYHWESKDELETMKVNNDKEINAPVED